MIESLNDVLYAAMLGAAYALFFWATKNIDPTKPSPAIDWVKLIATTAVGAVIALFYTVQIVVVENVFSTLWNMFKTWYQKRTSIQ
jgi:hypothetical protein